MIIPMWLFEASLCGLFVFGGWLLLAYMFAKADLNILYKIVPPERFGFIVSLGTVRGVIYNSNRYKLVYDAKMEYGKFVEKTNSEKQKLGPVESLLGIRFIGIPFLHGLFKKELSWTIRDPQGKFIPRKEEKCLFAITKTFGFVLKDLTLGGDSDGSSGQNDAGQKDQLIEVNIHLTAQLVIFDPYMAIVKTDSMMGTETKLTRCVQSYLGRTSQNELVRQKGDQCDLIKEIIEDKSSIEAFGVTFDNKKLTYVDYELAGGEETSNRIRKANTERYEASQKAIRIGMEKEAEQKGMLAQQKVIVDMIKQLIAEGMSPEQAERIVNEMLRTKRVENLGGTGVTTYVEGGASTTVAIPTGSKKGK
ncbi:MAG: hypothetical protein WCO10_03775 [bacterium]